MKLRSSRGRNPFRSGHASMPGLSLRIPAAQVLDYAGLGKPATTDVVIRPVR